MNKLGILRRSVPRLDDDPVVSALAVESMGIGRFDYDPSSGVQRFCARCKQICGLAPEDEPTPTRIEGLVHPDDRFAVRAVMESLNPAGSGEFIVEHRIVRPDGAVRWLEVRGRTIFEGSGSERRAHRVVGAVRDITARREDTQQLAELAAIYSGAPIGLCVLDRDLRYVRINDRLAEVHGIPAREHVGRTVSEIVPDLAPAIEPLFRKVLDTREALLNQEVRGETVAQPGVKRTWVQHWYPLFSPRGDVIGISVAVEEVTEQRRTTEARERAEQALRARSEELAQTLDTAAIGLTRLDREWRYLSANPAYAALIGRPREQIIGHSALEVMGPQGVEKIRPYVERVLAGEAVEYEVETPFAASEPRWIRVKYSPWMGQDESVGGWVASVEDVSGRKNAERALRESQRLFQALADNIPTLCWMADATGGIYWYNARWYQYTGTTFDQMQGWGWQTVHDPTVLPQVLDRWKGAIAQGTPFEMVFPLKGVAANSGRF